MAKSVGRIWERVARSQRGFTLAELLVVGGMVVGLAAVILPNVGQFTGEGEGGAPATEVARVQAAVDAYGADANNTVTAATGWTNDLLTGGGGIDLTGYLRLPGSATDTADRYCWGSDGTVRQESTDASPSCP
ncbi:MAG: type II secretion system protein [Chloroflexi bacterium]|nr:type II secretion system protein [Chloroflexota bacterium]